MDFVNRPVDQEFLRCGPPDRDTPRPLTRLQPPQRPHPRPGHNILNSVSRPHSFFSLTSLAFSVRLKRDRKHSCSESQEPYTVLKRIWDLLARGGILGEASSPGVQSGSAHLCHTSTVEPCGRILQTRRRYVCPFPLPHSLQCSSIPSGYVYFVNCSQITTITPDQLGLTTHRQHAPLPH